MMQLDLKVNSSQEETLTDHYMVLGTLGKGSFAEVKLACHLHTEMQVAVKIMERGEKNDTIIMSEVNIFKSLYHPNIIKLFQIIETTEHTYMVMEHATGGDLVSHIEKKGSLQEKEARHIFTQMVCAVNYCHENSIAHRDIKSDNILLDGKGIIKLCDFGLATKVASGQRFKGFCGTLEYCAPEIFTDQEYDAQASDIWSMGVVLYTMLTGHFPFKAKTYSQMKVELLNQKYAIPSTLSQSTENLIVQLFTVDPGQRPNIRDIMAHKWLKDSEELSKLVSSLDPLPSSPNPSIVAAMWAMGYNTKDIRDSLRERKFNNIMATYLILKHQKLWKDNTNHQIKPAQPSVLTPVGPPTLHLSLKRTKSELALYTIILPAKHQLSDDDKTGRKNGNRRHSMPNIPCCRQERSLPPNADPQHGPVASQLMDRNFRETCVASGGVSSSSTSSEGISSGKHLSYDAHLDVTTPKSTSCTQNMSSDKNPREAPQGVTTTSTQENGKSLSSQEASEGKFRSAQSQGTNRTSPRNLRRAWKRVKRRLVDCMRSLCCCLPVQQRSHFFQKEVAPMEGEGSAVQNQ